jgi:hypothetical protein
MANLDNVLHELRAVHQQAQLQVEKLDEAISVIEDYSQLLRTRRRTGLL